jgi:hypothetical protein
MTATISTTVKEAIYCYEQSTPEKYEEDLHRALRYETCLYELFNIMSDEETASYKQQLIDLGYVSSDHYTKN